MKGNRDERIYLAIQRIEDKLREEDLPKDSNDYLLKQINILRMHLDVIFKINRKTQEK